MSDLVSGVLTRLAELERPELDTFVERRMDWSYSGDAGEIVVVRCRECDWSATGAEHELIPQADAHVQEQHPTAVLRLCRAHRQVVELHGRMWIYPNHPNFNDAHLTKEPMPICRSCQPETMWRRAESWPCRTLGAVAAAYGMEAEFEAEKARAKRIADVLHGRAVGLGVVEEEDRK